RPCLRAGATPGEQIWVTGELGLAAEALASPCPRPEALAALRRPPIPAPLGARLAEEGLATAMIDLSDGLARDLARLCRASGVGAVVDPAALPARTSLGEAVALGEDYQLCFTAPPARRVLIESLSSATGVAFTAIGTTTPAPEVLLLGHELWPRAQFDHFEDTSS
ncbi:MAG: thiamine-phosphate kinase, partial [Deltaproteobacteria bacterium]|nr:thiamine-phosphate kinase [Deltaproteobacteria bacterium]